jgi:hypothetical protein
LPSGKRAYHDLAFQMDEAKVDLDFDFDSQKTDHVIAYFPPLTVVVPSGQNIVASVEAWRTGEIRAPVVLEFFEVIGLGGLGGVLTVLPRKVGVTRPPQPEPEPGPDPLDLLPEGGKLIGGALEIFTTADYVGPVKLSMGYDPSNIMNEENLKLMEFDQDGNQWKDITTVIDLVRHRIHGEVPELHSTFAIVEWTGVSQPETISVGNYPSMNHNIIAFQTSEAETSQDLNGDGDTNDDVIRYYDLSEKTLTNIGWAGKNSAVSGDIIAFESDYHVGYYNITSNSTVIAFALGSHPSISGDIIAFSTNEGLAGDLNGDNDTNDFIIRYYKLATYATINTQVEGIYPSVNGNIIAFQAYDELQRPVIKYYDVARGTVTSVGVLGDFPSVSGNIIAFQTNETIAGDLNGDADDDDLVIQYFNLSTMNITNTGVIGAYPSVSGNIIEFTVEESMVDIDLNQDGDKTDSVIQYYDISAGKITDTAEVGTRPSISGNIIAFVSSENMLSRDFNGDEDLDDTVVRYFNKVISQPMLPSTSALDFVIAPLGGAVGNLAGTASIEIPAGALHSDSTVAIETVPLPDYGDFLTQHAGIIVSTGVYKIGPIFTNLTQQAQVTLAYNETRVDETMTEQLLVYFSQDNVNWQELPVPIVDTVLNILRFPASRFGYFVILRDTQPPTTELAVLVVDPPGQIIVFPGTRFALTATDALSWPMYSYYRINNGTWTYYDTPFSLVGPNGNYTIDYYTIDFARNREPPSTITVFLYNPPPQKVTGGGRLAPR